MSAAYYGLFHLLVEDGAHVMFAGNDASDLRDIVQRAYEHRTIKEAAKGFGGGNPAEPWKSLLPMPSKDLSFVASTFIDLQQARHEADYDPGHSLTRAEAVELVERAEAACTTWKAVRKGAGSKSYSLEARVFLAAILVHDQVRHR